MNTIRRKLNKHAAKLFTIFLAVILVTLSLNSYSSVFGATGEYKTWRQSDSRWANKYLGTSGETMSQIGCAVTSVASLVVHSKSRSESTFNPGILVDYLSANGGFDSGGNIYWGSVSGLVPEFTFSKTVTFSETTVSGKASELKNYLAQGYYAVICVKYGGHWVAVDRVSGSTVYIMDQHLLDIQIYSHLMLLKVLHILNYLKD
jgi:hypothetical protein